MSLYLIEHTVKIVNQDIPEESRWSAVWHPVIWKFQRRDFVITAINDPGSPVGVEIIASGDFTSELEIDDYIFVNSDNGNQYGSFQILSFSYDSGNDETSIIYDNAPGTGMAATGYANLIDARTAYLMNVAIYDYATGTRKLITSEYGEFRPDTEGTIKADLQEWLQSTVTLPNQFDYLARTEAAKYLGHRYDIEIREYWKEAGYGNWVTSNDEGDLDDHYVTNSAKQLGDLYGQNMGEFVMWATNPTYEHTKGKFLTRFKRPVFFVGYPFDLGFCYDRAITDAGQRLSAYESQKDINGNELSTSDDLIDDNNSILNRVTLKAVFDQVDYATNVKTVDFYLKAKTNSGGTDPVLNWGISNFSPRTGEYAIVDRTNNIILGYTDWDTDFDTTMARLVTSINTNVSQGSINTSFWTTEPFDNSEGYYASWNVGSQTLTVNAPLGSGASYNGVSISLERDTGGVPAAPSQIQALSGGVDSVLSDAAGLTTARVSEIKTIDVNSDCQENDVYLRWSVACGAYDYWCFRKTQNIKDTSSNEGSYEKYVENISDSNRRKIVFEKDSQEEITLGVEGVDNDQIEGLRHLLYALEVDMFIPNNLSTDVANYSWLGVTIKTGSFNIKDTIDNSHILEFTLLLPQRYNQKQ